MKPKRNTIERKNKEKIRMYFEKSDFFLQSKRSACMVRKNVKGGIEDGDKTDIKKKKTI